MKNFQTPLLKFTLLLSGLFVSSSLFAASTQEEIWSYVFLIPIYFVLILQSLLVLLALTMKQFKSKKLLLTTAGIGSTMITLGIATAYYFVPIDKLGTHLLYYFLLGLVVLILPLIQYKLLNKSENITS
jgi:uncharacterized membrane protein